jgi:hypothetical protein
MLATLVLATKNVGTDVESLIVAGAQFGYQNLLLGGSMIEPKNGTSHTRVEGVAMLNLAVDVPEKESHLFSQPAGSLEQQTWVSEEDFYRGFQDKDLERFFGDNDDIDPIRTCIHGLCLKSTSLAIEQRLKSKNID